MEEAKGKKDKGIFRRKKAKGPNPLAVRRKNADKKGGGSAGAASQAPHRKRARKRGGKEGSAGEAAGSQPAT